MSQAVLDHIVVTAPNLSVGAEWVYQALGVKMQKGGEHPQMGTHNLLLRLGEGLFLEVIAPNRAAKAPSRPRWFALDSLKPDSPPQLSHWLARTTDIKTLHAACAESLGDIVPMSRGDKHWLITIPADGNPVLGGAMPGLLEWETPMHPADGLPDQGLLLRKLQVYHPQPERISQALDSMQFSGSVEVLFSSRPELLAVIDTPIGVRELSSSPALLSER